MAKFKGKLNIATINSLKGFLDFYTRGDETIVRTWPKNRGKSQTPNSIPWQRVFANFMECYGPLGGGERAFIPRGTTGPQWTSRDYTMSLYYGKPKLPPQFTYDNRPPWPPPIPDPLDRLFVINRPLGAYSIFSGVNLSWTRCPQGQTHVYITATPPVASHKSFYRRRNKHVTVTTFHFINAAFLIRSARRGDFFGGNQLTTFFRSLNEHFYFFMITGNPFGSPYISQSPVYVASINPGPGGGEIGATINGPFVLTPRLLEFTAPLAP